MEYESVFNIIDNHRTIRKYKKMSIPSQHMDMIIKAGLRAPSSANLQSYGIIRIIDTQLREKIAYLAGEQEHIIESSEFLLFYADLYRLKKCLELMGGTSYQPNFMMLYVATIDASLAAQNIVIMAEALGYGTCYIGGIQNNPCEIASLLNLPKYCYPLFGLTIGTPDENPERRFRLSEKVIVSINYYDRDKPYKAIKEYSQRNVYESFKRRLNRYISKEGRLNKRYNIFRECLHKMGIEV